MNLVKSEFTVTFDKQMNTTNSKITGGRENIWKFSKNVSHIYIVTSFLGVHETDTSVLWQEKESFRSSCPPHF